MSAPFREEEAAALARAEALEAENEELRIELERLKDHAGEGRASDVTTIKAELDAVKFELEAFKTQRDPKLDALAKRQESRADTQVLVMLIVAMSFLVGLLGYLFRR